MNVWAISQGQEVVRLIIQEEKPSLPVWERANGPWDLMDLLPSGVYLSKDPEEPPLVRGLGCPTAMTWCAVCGEPQINSPSGKYCKNGHGGADSLREPPIPDKINSW